MRSRRSAALALALLVPLAACSSDDDPSTDPSTSPARSDVAPTAATTDGTTTDVATSEPSGPGPARAALDDVRGWMADPASIDSDRLAAAFLAEVSVDQLAGVLVSVGTGAWQADAVEEIPPSGVVATLTGPGPALAVQLTVDGSGRIDGLLFQPTELTNPPDTLAGLVTRLDEATESSAFLAARIGDDGTCQSVEFSNADTPVPLGSAFKLYVLGAVATAIADGLVTWDQPVTIRDELDSLPSGTTQDEPAGTTLPVRELAQRMIEVSDNTATDHLIDLVGRDAVESALTDLGHHDPAVTLPFPTTRELSVIKADTDLLARYEAADEAGRRALLTGEVAAAPLPGLDAFWTEPRAVTTVEWFASPFDICRVLVALDDLAGRPSLEPVADILSTNPGGPVDPAQFTRVLFKGGSEPGVLFGAWLATRPDGSRIVVTGGAANTTTDVDPMVLQLLNLGLTLTPP